MFLIRCVFFVKKAVNRVLMLGAKSLFRKAGKGVIFFPGDVFTYENITLGSDVYIGPGANFSAAKASITVGNKVLFGPGVTIITGNHHFKKLGTYIYDVKEKDIEDDAPVVIEDDVWVGANVTILKGITIAQGAVVGAGSVVTKSIAPYTIAVGVPAKKVAMRFTEEQILLHEKELGVQRV